MKLFLFAQLLCCALIMVGCSAEPEPVPPAASLVKTETSVQKPSTDLFANFQDIWKVRSTKTAQSESIPATARSRQAARPDILAATSDLSKLAPTSVLSNVPETSDLSNLAETSNRSSLPETSDLSK